jgi:hypothetical protein
MNLVTFKKGYNSWQKARSNLFRLQQKIFKASFTKDIYYAIKIQKLLLTSKSARLVAIRYVTKLNFKKTSNFILNELNGFKLNNYILKNIYNWIPKKYKKLLISNKENTIIKLPIWQTTDLCWQCLLKFCIEPAHEANFSPRSYGFRNIFLLHEVQKVLYSNFSKESKGFQKRLLNFKLPLFYKHFNYSILLKKIICPRFIKLSLFRFFNSGLYPFFSEEFKELDYINSLLSNILLDGIENINNSIRFGPFYLYFLCPLENETTNIEKVNKFLNNIGINKV